jgi:hypothetical protein
MRRRLIDPVLIGKPLNSRGQVRHHQGGDGIIIDAWHGVSERQPRATDIEFLSMAGSVSPAAGFLCGVCRHGHAQFRYMQVKGWFEYL